VAVPRCQCRPLKDVTCNSSLPRLVLHFQCRTPPEGDRDAKENEWTNAPVNNFDNPDARSTGIVEFRLLWGLELGGKSQAKLPKLPGNIAEAHRKYYESSPNVLLKPIRKAAE
jgi:hypothetical protein